MKSAAVVLLAVTASLVSAQFPGVPSCGVTCLEKYLPQVGCAITDVGCQCSAAVQAKLEPLVATCFTTNCNATELAQAIAAGKQDCADYSATASVASSSSVATTSSSMSSAKTTSMTTTTPVSSKAVTSMAVTSMSVMTSNVTTTSTSPSTSATAVKAGAAGGPVVGAFAAVMAAVAVL